VGLAILQGAGVLAVVLVIFAAALARGQGADEARALAFTTLIVANLCLILTNRAWSRTILQTLHTPNAALVWVVAGAGLLLVLVLAVPALRDLFRFSRLHPNDLALCLGAGVSSIAWFEAFKFLRRARMGVPDGRRGKI
jgi:Ca2+-transporting ATPase